ncbi:hypothetical protein [Staphylococcus aureus]|uniref:hypothetical protein n=1 Tax=Staphylococcus aureus TaxID=1280 RepID=UPI0020BE4246|nr:hypothetical protein [Staphylococcus aureus]
MGSTKIQVLGGKIGFEKLNTDLSEKDYAVAKAIVWLNMINDRMRPKKWLKARKNGTNINFDAIHTETDAKEAIEELKGYLAEIKEKHGIDLKYDA